MGSGVFVDVLAGSRKGLEASAGAVRQCLRVLPILLRILGTRHIQLVSCRLELIQGSPNTPVDPAQGTGTHHIGYFVEDPKAETERLLAQGGELVMCAASPEEGYGRFTYVRWPNGMLVEPVALANKERFEAWWAGGELQRPASA